MAGAPASRRHRRYRVKYIIVVVIDWRRSVVVSSSRRGEMRAASYYFSGVEGILYRRSALYRAVGLLISHCGSFCLLPLCEADRRHERHCGWPARLMRREKARPAQRPGPSKRGASKWRCMLCNSLCASNHGAMAASWRRWPLQARRERQTAKHNKS